MAAEPTNTGPMDDLTAFQRDLLAVINHLDAPHGLGVKQEIEVLYREEVLHGRLYPNLDTLTEMGLIEKGEKDARTNEYRVTARGERELASHIAWMMGPRDE